MTIWYKLGRALTVPVIVLWIIIRAILLLGVIAACAVGVAAIYWLLVYVAVPFLVTVYGILFVILMVLLYIASKVSR